MQNSETLTKMYGRPLRIREWDACSERPPIYDGTWEICVAKVTTWNAVQCAYNYLVTAQHTFRTLVLDSISELQRRCKENIIAPTEMMQQQHWGQLLTLMDTVIRGMRDMKDVPRNPIEVVVFIAETRMADGKWRPYMQGQITIALPYWMDVVGYLYVDNEADENGTYTKKVRKLLVTPHPMYEAGERIQGVLGDVVPEPNITMMLRKIYPSQNGQEAAS